MMSRQDCRYRSARPGEQRILHGAGYGCDDAHQCGSSVDTSIGHASISVSWRVHCENGKHAMNMISDPILAGLSLSTQSIAVNNFSFFFGLF